MSNKDFRHRERDDVDFGRKPKKQAGKGKSTKPLYYEEIDDSEQDVYYDGDDNENTY